MRPLRQAMWVIVLVMTRMPWFEVRVVLIDLPGQIGIGRGRDQTHGRVVRSGLVGVFVLLDGPLVVARLLGHGTTPSLPAWRLGSGHVVACGIRFPFRAANRQYRLMIRTDLSLDGSLRPGDRLAAGTARQTGDQRLFVPAAIVQPERAAQGLKFVPAERFEQVRRLDRPCAGNRLNHRVFRLARKAGKPDLRRQPGESRPRKCLQYPPPLHHVIVRGWFSKSGKTRHKDTDLPEPPGGAGLCHYDV